MASNVIPADVVEGADLPPIVRTPEVIDLVLFSGVLWATHKIHYDLDYSREEGYDHILVHAPLQGAYLSQLVTEWLGSRGKLVALRYRNKVTVPVNIELTLGGRVVAVDQEAGEATCEVWVQKADGDRSCVGEAVARFG